MAEIYVDVRGETCPVPLVEMRKAVRRAQPGDVIAITGNNAASKKEIPMAADALSLAVTSIEEQDGTWTIKIQK
ncbi:MULTISPECIES: sulfurtransferase TusA family protein [Acetobacterium]|uniref:Sulfurtransferase TusA n=1 Tax=Acetobacterium wieringae TaxID=52694 RepID=A0A1F2PHE3_9FIRM|nr:MULTISPECIES: sulfurtransferase TusA family protein [Acetobacterium]OFV70394.1 sulfurtransferase TusA [Acetobacterium wieringae]OXS27536.1 MAG: SirA family protein [Acetobacterium sp. MES1]URN85945.1 sulfurtransferase TusA family protein [Acetobacterium wieringae]